MQSSRESSETRSSLQAKQYNTTFKQSNEILYLFYSADKLNWPYISKIGVQKCIYLSEVLSPLKEIVLAFLNFVYWHRGPYSKDVQNLLDHLVSINAIDVISFSTYGASSYVDYRITEAGKFLVEDLVLYPAEKEKSDWINIIVKIIDAYKGSINLSEEFEGVDKIVALVYQEPSFKEVQQKEGKWQLIPVGYKNNLTMELVHFLEKVEQNLPEKFDRDRYKLDLETILLSFFEYLYVEHLSQR